MEQSKEAAKEFILNGGKAVFRYGWAFKGASARLITQEEALKKLSSPAWGFGKGFYILSWKKDETGADVLEFNELGENDMW